MLRVTSSAQHYYLDPYARELEVIVTRCVERDTGSWVELDRTIFFPTGGGQPHDRGRLGERAVLDVQKRGGQIEHLLDAPIEVGTPLCATLDWTRRFDHMQQHTGQHLLSAIAQDGFGWPTMAFHLGEQSCTVDLDVPAMGDAERLELEARVNRAIREARPLRARELSRVEFDELEVRTRGLPDEVTDSIRLIEIEGIDLNTCGGTHLRNTSELNALKLLHTEKIRGQTRLHFLAGGRVLERCERQLQRERTLNDLLKAGPEDHAELIRRAQASTKQSRRVVNALLDEVAANTAATLVSSDAPILVHHHELGDTSRDFLPKLLRELQARDVNRPVFLTARDEGPGEHGSFSLSASPQFVDAVRSLVLESLDAKGGGRPGHLQGKAASLDAHHRSALVTRLLDAIARAE